jgi:guanine deaminase
MKQKHTLNEAFMRRAIELSEKAAIKEKTGGVFGAVVVKDGQIVGEAQNMVIKNHDPTAHAEVLAIRDAAKKLNTVHLDGCVLYTAGEPCPMCLCASYWAHIDHIFYASKVEDALKYGEFKDVNYFDEMRKNPKDRQIKCTECLRENAVEVWKKYNVMPGRVPY